MAISPSSSVRQARAALVQRLREIRLDAGLTARALALAAGWHESKVSRIEHVRTPPSDADIRLWCQICGAKDQAADLIASSRAADSMYTEWRRLEVTGLRHLQESLVPLYEQTTRFRAYQSHVVPGLFQTPAYAAALLSAISAFRGIPDDSERAADARLERSRILYDQDHLCRTLLPNNSLTSKTAASPHGCSGPSTAPTNARAALARSARPASVTLSRTAVSAISAPTFPAALVPGNHAGHRADNADARPTRRRTSSRNTPPARPSVTVRGKADGAHRPSW